MNFELSDEQQFLREAARGALSRLGTVAAARDALDGAPLPDLWPTAVAAGWPGLLIAEEHGGAGLGGFDAMLVMAECGRVLAPIPLLGHLVASALLGAACVRGHDAGMVARMRDVAAGDVRLAAILAEPPTDLSSAWGTSVRAEASRLDGDARFAIDLPGADAVIVVATASDAPGAYAIEASALAIEPVTAFDATRSVGHATLSGVPAAALRCEPSDLAAAWHLGQSLLAAESLGAAEAALEMTVEYARQRFAFGRAIGSYQAIKHMLVEVLREIENARSLIYYAGWASEAAVDQLALAASAARVAAARALDSAARATIAVHGGIGATWEHDAHLYFRRAQVTRRLLGGARPAADRVAGELLAQARA